jgi:hypothetical protein
MLCTHFLMTEYTSDQLERAQVPHANPVHHAQDCAPAVVRLPESDTHTSMLQRYATRLRRVNLSTLLYSI